MGREPPALPSLSDTEKEALKFLDRDFNQCFQQMRHYDAQVLDVAKFLLTVYSGLIGLALALRQFAIKEQVDLQYPIVASLGAALLLGLALYWCVVRNRVYFVHAARYINEQRRHFLRYKPLGFTNESRMYTDPAQPPFADFWSSQAIIATSIALLNSILIGMLAYIYFVDSNPPLTPYAVAGDIITAFLVQVLASARYLKSRENKSASTSVFGRE